MMTVNEIKAVAQQLNVAARHQIDEGKRIPTTVFLVARENPITGIGVDTTNVIIPMVQPQTLNKPAFIHAARAVAIACKARAAIICFDAWHVLFKRPPGATREEVIDSIKDIKPSEHIDREECISVLVEFDDGPVHRTRQPYRRDDGRIVFDPPENYEATLADRVGMLMILDEVAPTVEQVHSARNLAAFFLEGVPWLPKDWAPYADEVR